MVIDHVYITGVDERLAKALRAELVTREGMLLDRAPLREDLRRLWKLGVIEDAIVTIGEAEVTFELTPRRTITNVVRKGGDALAQSRFRRLEKAPFEPSRIVRMTEALQQSYVREGRLDAQVEARQRVHETGVDVCIATNPGPRITIAKLEFPGAKVMPAKALMKVLHGHLDVQIGKPKMHRRGKRLDVAIPITEGPSYRIGTITAPVPVALHSGSVFRRSDVVKVLEEIRKLSVDNVYPQTTLDRDARRVDITFEIEWRDPWDALRFWLASSRSPRARSSRPSCSVRACRRAARRRRAPSAATAGRWTAS